MTVVDERSSVVDLETLCGKCNSIYDQTRNEGVPLILVRDLEIPDTTAVARSNHYVGG